MLNVDFTKMEPNPANEKHDNPQRPEEHEETTLHNQRHSRGQMDPITRAAANFACGRRGTSIRTVTVGANRRMISSHHRYDVDGMEAWWAFVSTGKDSVIKWRQVNVHVRPRKHVVVAGSLSLPRATTTNCD